MTRKIRLQKPASDRLRERFERELNEAQRAAATAPDGFNLILAGPGSGKTRVITYRVAYLIARGVPAESILLVTFTRRAAREMVARLETLIGPKAVEGLGGDLPPRRQPHPPAVGEGDRLRAELHDPRRRGPARPRRPGDGRRRPRRHRPLRPEAGGGPAPHQLRLQRPAPAGRARSPNATPNGPNGPSDRGRRRGVREAQASEQLHGLRRPARPLGAACSTRAPSTGAAQGTHVPPRAGR